MTTVLSISRNKIDGKVHHNVLEGLKHLCYSRKPSSKNVHLSIMTGPLYQRTIQACLYLLLGFQLIAHPTLPEGFVFEEMTSSLIQPTALAIAPDGRIFITEKKGAIRIIENDVLLDAPFYQVETQTPNERGLAGIVLDPNFDENQFVYIYYTLPDKARNVVSRVTAAGNTVIPGSELVLLETDDGWASWHNGGAMVFDQSGKLIVGIGDHTSTAASWLNHMTGKVVRLNTDGSIPEDNPLLDQTEGKYQAIYAYGIRNPYSMAISKRSGRIFFDDVGNGDFEEINDLIAGRNYGWDFVEGYLPAGQRPPDENYTEPIHVYDHTEDKCAVVGAAFYEPEERNFPTEYDGKFFFLDYCTGVLFYMDPDTYEVKTFATGFDFANTLIIGEDGSLYVAQIWTGQLYRIRFAGSGEPFISSRVKDQVKAVGENAFFDFQLVGDAPIDYTWYKNNQPFESAPNSSQFTLESVDLDDNASQWFCIASNAKGRDTSNVANLQVIDGQRPSIEISITSNPTYSAGDIIQFEGSIIDPEDGDLPLENYNWTINFHHDEHFHPALGPVSGVQNSEYEVGLFGETDTNVWYRIILEGEDLSGLTNSHSVDVHPNLVTMPFSSSPSGVTINIDGQMVKTDYTLSSVQNLNRVVLMPVYDIVDNRLVAFDSWADNQSKERSRTFSAENIEDIHVIFEDRGPYQLGNASGLNVDYYTGIGPERVFYRSGADAGIDHNWDVKSPWEWEEDYPTDSFSVQWNGYFTAPFTADYTFYFRHDGIINLTFDNEQIISDALGKDDATTVDSVKVSLIGGQQYAFDLDYQHLTYIARIQWSYAFDVVDQTIVPTTQFDNTLVNVPDTHSNECLLTAYPNPSVTDEVRFEFSEFSCSQSVDRLIVYDVHGREIIEVEKPFFENTGFTLGIDHILQGTYYAQFAIDGNIKTCSFVKSK